MYSKFSTLPILYIAVFDVDNLLGYDTNAYQLIQHVVAACFYLNFSHTNVNGLATPLVDMHVIIHLLVSELILIFKMIGCWPVV